MINIVNQRPETSEKKQINSDYKEGKGKASGSKQKQDMVISKPNATYQTEENGNNLLNINIKSHINTGGG